MPTLVLRLKTEQMEFLFDKARKQNDPKKSDAAIYEEFIIEMIKKRISEKDKPSRSIVKRGVVYQDLKSGIAIAPIKPKK